MLGGGSQGNGAFSCSSSPALPSARRHHHHHHHHNQQQQLHQQQQAMHAAAAVCWNANNPFSGAVPSVVVPSSASEEAQSIAASVPSSATTTSLSLYGGVAPIQRKRPGCLCDDYDKDDDDDDDGYNDQTSISSIRSSLHSSSGSASYLQATNPFHSAFRHCHPSIVDYGVVGSASGISSGSSSSILGDCVQPLDLSLPKVKVRQHWSGGSIVQVNDSTIISISNGNGGDCCGCPAVAAAAAAATASSTLGVAANAGGSVGDGSHASVSPPASSRLNVSVVTVPQQPCWSAGVGNSLALDRPVQQPFRLQIEIPLVAERPSAFLRPQSQPATPTLPTSSSASLATAAASSSSNHAAHHRRRSSYCNSSGSWNSNNYNSNNNAASAGGGSSSNNVAQPPSQRPPEVAAAMTEEDGDLQRLSDSAHQLRLSGYYYGHLSWKESAQLLQNTKVGTFLVRDSSDSRYLYALSLQTDRGPTSVRIHYSNRGFRLDATNTNMADDLPRFRTVLDLVDHYVSKWSHCRDRGQCWVDSNGQVHSEVMLNRPLMKTCPSLKHLCRLVWNNQRQKQHPSANATSSSSSSAEIPPTLQSYLDEYPYLH